MRQKSGSKLVRKKITSKWNFFFFFERFSLAWRRGKNILFIPLAGLGMEFFIFFLVGGGGLKGGLQWVKK